VREGKMNKKEKTHFQTQVEQVGQELDIIRKEKGLTTTALGARVGTSQAQVSRLLTGKQGFRFEMLFRYCFVLKVKPWEVLKRAADRTARK
jgi:transcriptional regulator with XRE-family HTH domain